ncbi:MAG: uracil-DNA glycosylase family protein [Bacteroidota bacterium]
MTVLPREQTSSSSSMTFAERIIQFNNRLQLEATLPENIRVMNPFQASEEVRKLSAAFYQKYYDDQQTRHLILGINPGRLGAGATGIPFTDPKRLKSHCGIESSFTLHEPSSVFVYNVIDAFGDPTSFYQYFYISSVCPLGFVRIDDKGRETNYNYYDSSELTETVTPFVIETLQTQLSFGIHRDKVFCMGTGKNYRFLRKLNEEHQFFGEVISLEHPRYVMQYKSKQKQLYIDKYLNALKFQ